MEIKGAVLLLWRHNQLASITKGTVAGSGCRGGGWAVSWGSSPPAHFLKHVLEPPGKGERKLPVLGKASSCFSSSSGFSPGFPGSQWAVLWWGHAF